jgi:hypothetical protein
MILKEDKKSIGSVHAHGSSGCGHCWNHLSAWISALTFLDNLYGELIPAALHSAFSEVLGI